MKSNYAVSILLATLLVSFASAQSSRAEEEPVEVILKEDPSIQAQADVDADLAKAAEDLQRHLLERTKKESAERERIEKVAKDYEKEVEAQTREMAIERERAEALANESIPPRCDTNCESTKPARVRETKVHVLGGFRSNLGSVHGYGGVAGGKISIKNEESHEGSGEAIFGGMGNNTVIGSLKTRALFAPNPDSKNLFGFELSQESNPISHRALGKLLYARKLGKNKLVLGLHGGRDGDRTTGTSALAMGVGAEVSASISDLLDIAAIAEYSASFGQGRDMETRVDIISPTEQLTTVTRTGMRQDGWNGVSKLGLALSRTFGGGGTLTLHGAIQDRQSKLVEYGFQDIAQYEADSKSIEFGITAAVKVE